MHFAIVLHVFYNTVYFLLVQGTANRIALFDHSHGEDNLLMPLGKGGVYFLNMQRDIGVVLSPRYPNNRITQR